MLKPLDTDVKSSIKSNLVWFIFPKSLQIFQYISGKDKKNFAEQKYGLNLKNETFKKTALITPFRLQTFHRTSSITKYTSKAFIAFVVTSPGCV